jgi:hypothetical protein
MIKISYFNKARQMAIYGLGMSKLIDGRPEINGAGAMRPGREQGSPAHTTQAPK